MSSDMAFSSSRAETDTDLESSSSSRKKKKKSKDKEKDMEKVCKLLFSSPSTIYKSTIFLSPNKVLIDY